VSFKSLLPQPARVVLRATLWLAILGVGFSLPACTSPTSPSARVEFATIDVRTGTGIEAEQGKFVMVNYTGWLYDPTHPEGKGEQFDASPPGQPFVFPLGGLVVIGGWDRGVVGMKVGGLRRLIIPASLGYGREGAGSRIPPNASLVFEIELLAVS
jgi:FKBP-type peptidyl-prolyl cis-trans isomerase FkpA